MSPRVLSPTECRLLLCSKRVGRVVFTDRALPSALPVNYLVADGGVVFRTDPHGLLAAMLVGAGDAVLGFEVDEVDENLESGWSVLVVGLAARVPEHSAQAFDGARLRSWGSPDGDSFIRIPLDRMTGRAVGPAASRDVAGSVARGGSLA